MVVGIIGLGCVGGTLKKWFDNYTTHSIRVKDIAQKIDQDFTGIDCCFICIDVPHGTTGQDQTNLESCVELAKTYTPNVFVKSTVLPGTNDRLGTVSMPEFLTARRAYQDMCELPVVMGENWFPIGKLFPKKKVIMMKNVECEMAKYMHNCFGAFKVTYFNMMKEICDSVGADFGTTKKGAMITGFIEKEHTEVPGPDGFYGYGGKCFPNNMEAMKSFLRTKELPSYPLFLRVIAMNDAFREKPTEEFEGVHV